MTKDEDRPKLRVLEFPGPSSRQIDNAWAEQTLTNVVDGIAERASEHSDPVVGVAVCVAYKSGTVGLSWAGSHRLLLIGGLFSLQRVVLEEEPR